MGTDSFFLDSIKGESSYVNTRDMNCNGAIECKKFIEKLWLQYQKHADKHFRTDAPKHFQQRFWEMYLGVTLENYGFKIKNAGAKGPEFFTYVDDIKVWFEAIAPIQGSGNDAVPEMKYNLDVATKVPEDKIILRITHAIREKHKKFETYLNSNIIKPNDSYIIAINSKSIRFIVGEPVIPYIVKSVFPFGNPAVEWDIRTCKVVNSYHEFRDKITKGNKSSVSTSIFLEQPGYSGVSAVLYSSVGIVDHSVKFGSDFYLVHNPNATNPIKRGSFNMGTEYWLEDNILKRKRNH